MISREINYQRSEQFISSDLGEAMILSDSQSDKFYGTNAVGLSVWELLKSPLPFHEVVEGLLKEFSVEKDQCEMEVETFMNELAKVGAIQEVNE
ncbi:MAG: hypothetical protein ACJAXX_001301 [Roseivirga sp.]|jgi:hypothetical protein